MKYKKDITEYIDNYINDIVESFLDIWKERFYRRKLSWVIQDFYLVYDFSGERECIEKTLGRKITDKEETYFKNRFIKEISKIYYDKL